MIEADTVFMKRALDQARRGAGLVSPNPMVGAILVKDGQVVGEGFHRYDSRKHSETYAIEMAGRQARGATLYCNLEPCCHHGRTPPCTDALIEAGISRAVIATKDPYAQVNGKGVEQLREAGIEVDVGLLEERARKLNESYFKFVSSGRPFVHGIIEYPSTPQVDWHPSSEFLEFASKYDAVMIGTRAELNRVVIDRALARDRHRALVVVADNTDRGLLKALRKRVNGEFSVVPFERLPDTSETGNVLRLEDSPGYDGTEPRMKSLLVTLTRSEVTSLLLLPGLLDSSDTAFGEFDKVTLAVPSIAYEQGFSTRWVFGDIEFDLEDVSIEQAGPYTELTGYPSLQEVA
ncbi:MAG TPA: bifunctional diaminohydroxyphosphoribosylaminopyrimidine deaminase/5-amino-6-(5-phosphoribosylamino)uracil reductase RibD [Blastocatellia bacterium]|nr:bifunctional diaminohydroxyphosphoribosylaminopyrimidine deaminase/5-amino-6-(5-phosphoribosylamino)uracil reductase RibD [Blastocatellia bacterium]